MSGRLLKEDGGMEQELTRKCHSNDFVLARKGGKRNNDKTISVNSKERT